MKIQKVTEIVPDGHRNTPGRWKDVFGKVADLKDNEWLPVEMDTIVGVHRLANSARTHRLFLIQAKTRGLTVYLRNMQPGLSRRQNRKRK